LIHHVVEWVASTTEYLHVMDLMALPTYREGFPNVALEAAAAEKPMVATRATGVVDAVVDGVTGLLSPVGDPRMLSVNIVKLLTQKELAKSMGLAARRRVEVEFSMERFSAGLESFYLNLCRERGLSCRVKKEIKLAGSKMLD
jgi:glycosyltransferase involved in cell wall biosynthesis